MHSSLEIGCIKRAFVLQSMNKPYLCLCFGRQVCFLSSLEIFSASHFWPPGTWTHYSRHCWCRPPYCGPPPSLPGTKVATFWARWEHPPQAFITISFPERFLWYQGRGRSWGFKAPGRTTLKQWRRAVRGIMFQLSHHLVGQFWSLSYTVLPRVPRRIAAQVPTVVSRWLMHLSSTFLPSLSHFPHSFTFASQDRLTNTLPAPKPLERGLLWGKMWPTHPLLFKDLTSSWNLVEVKDKLPE